MIYQTFRNIDNLFILSFKSHDNDLERDSYDKYYMSLVEIKYFMALIDSKLSFDQPAKNKQGVYKKLAKVLRNDDFTTGNSLDCLYHQKHDKLNGIDYPRQKKIQVFLNKLLS